MTRETDLLNELTTRTETVFAIGADREAPWEYAAYWGDGASRAGCLFYNCSDQCRTTGLSIANPDWDSDKWEEFALAVAAQWDRVVHALRTGDGTHGWSGDDADNLQRLGYWAVYMIGATSVAHCTVEVFTLEELKEVNPEAFPEFTNGGRNRRARIPPVHPTKSSIA